VAQEHGLQTSPVNKPRIYFERKISKSFYGAVYSEQWSGRYCVSLCKEPVGASFKVHEN
jgi:hypothetical protein